MVGAASGPDWEPQVRALYRRGIAIETALHFLYRERPGPQAFQRWLHWDASLSLPMPFRLQDWYAWATGPLCHSTRFEIE